MKRSIAVICAVACLLLIAGCTKKESNAPASGASPQASQAAFPLRKQVEFAFNDVAVATSGTNLLRLGFTVHNISKDPVQCDPSEFSITLSDGTVIPADQSAENKCTPDSIDPGTTGTARAYFVLKPGYTGPITLSMAANGAIVGKGDTAVK